jgi:hypothetical protein
MSESDEHSHRRVTPAAVWGTGLGLISLPILYVLSLGPLVWSLRRGWVSLWMRPAVEWYLVPINFLFNLEKTSWLEPLLYVVGNYLELWE